LFFSIRGIEAGGHGSNSATPLTSLVPSFLSALASEDTPILAAGGLANGAHLASMLALGASGAVYGTRFLLSEESLYSAHQKQALKSATSASATVRTMSFDELRGTLDWPEGVDGRALMNSSVSDVGKYNLEDRKRRFQEGTKSGDPDRILVWAGMGVHLMHDLVPSQTVLENIHTAAVDRLTALQDALTSV